MLTRRMFAVAACGILVGVAWGLWTNLAETATVDYEVRPVGVMVNGSVELGARGGAEPVFFGSGRGTVVALELYAPPGGIVRVIPERSRIIEFVDSTNTTLKPGGPSGTGFEHGSRLSVDRTRVVWQLTSPTVPSAQASSIRAKGVVALRMASERGTARTKALEIAKDASISVGPFSLEVSHAAESPFDPSKFDLTFQSVDDLDGIVNITFFDPHGEPISAVPAATGRLRLGGRDLWTRAFEVDSHLEKTVIEIEYWQDSKVVEVPFDLEVSLGL